MPEKEAWKICSFEQIFKSMNISINLAVVQTLTISKIEKINWEYN